MQRLGMAMALWAFFVCGVAHADGPDPAAAEVLFREGREATAHGDYERACDKFSESLRLDPAQGTALNLADCEEHVGRLTSAWQRFLDLAAELPPGDDRKAIAQARANALDKRVPRLSVTLVPGAPGGTKVLRDDVELGVASLGEKLPVNPGPHAVVVTSPGRGDRRYALTLAEGEVQSVDVEPGSALPAADAPVRSPAVDQRTAGFVVAGFGVAAVGAGAIFGVVALSKKSDSDADCAGGVCRMQAGIDAYSSAKTMARVADVCLAAGIVALGVGGYLILSNKPGAATGPTRSAALLLAPTASSTGGGIALSGGW
jgi:hypothetical protein